MRHRLALPLLASVILASTFASAQEEPSSADVSAARALGQEGVKLADAGNCKDAIDKLARSEKLFHAPTTLERLGECQVLVGKLVDGSENLNKVARENVAANAPQAFREAQERAKRILAETKPKIAKLKIAVAGGSNYVVKLDGDVVPPANLNMNRPTDPGEHTVEASAQGYKTTSAKVTLPEGGIDSVALTLEVDPDAPKPEPVATQPSNANNTIAPQPSVSTVPAEQPARANRLPAYISLGVGAAGVVVGSVFGLVALGKKSDVESACEGTKCPSKVQDDIDSGRTFGTISTVSFIVGAVGLVAGAYLWVSSTPKAGSATRRTFVGANGLKLSF